MPNQLKKNNRAVGSITKTDLGSQKIDNKDIGSQGNTNNTNSNTTGNIGSAKGRDDSSLVEDLFQGRERQHIYNRNAIIPLL